MYLFLFSIHKNVLNFRGKAFEAFDMIPYEILLSFYLSKLLPITLHSRLTTKTNRSFSLETLPGFDRSSTSWSGTSTSGLYTFCRVTMFILWFLQLYFKHGPSTFKYVSTALLIYICIWFRIYSITNLMFSNSYNSASNHFLYIFLVKRTEIGISKVSRNWRIQSTSLNDQKPNC